MSVLGRPTWAIFDVNLHQRVTALVIADPKVAEKHIFTKKFSKCNSFQVTSDFTHDGSY